MFFTWWSLVPKFKTIMAGVIVISITGGAFWLWNREGFINELQSDIVIKNTYISNMENAVHAQNEKIKNLENRKADFDEVSETSKKKIIIIGGVERARLAAIANAKLGFTCEDNMKWLLDNAIDSKFIWRE